MTTEAEHPYPNLYRDGLQGKGLYIGSSVWRQAEMEHVSSMLMFFNQAANLGIQFWNCPVINDALIQRSRSRAATDFLKTDCQVFVTIDSDIAFRPEDILKIAEKAYEYSIVGGAYTKRMSGTKAELAIRVEPGTVIDFVDDNQKPIEIDLLSGGFIAIHRRVFEKLLETHAAELPLCHKGSSMEFYPFFADRIRMTKDGVNLFLSEDWAIQERAKEAGFKSYLDASVRLGHVGNYIYTYEDMIRPDRLSPRALRYTRGQGNQALVQGQRLPGDADVARPRDPVVPTKAGFKIHLMPDDKMISEAIWLDGVWEPDVHDAIVEHLKPGMTFLDLGANIGYFSLLAASRGNKVIAVEPMPAAIEVFKASIKENGYDDLIELHEVAVSNVNRKLTLVTTGLQNQGEAHLALLSEKNGPTVEVVTIDKVLGFKTPEFIKMDIEGEEWNLVNGAIDAGYDYFKQAKVVLFEYSPNQLKRNSQMERAEDLLDWFISHGFKLSKISRHNTYSDWIAIRE